MDHQEFESQLFLKGNKYELYHHDWHIEEVTFETGTWEYSDSILTLTHYSLVQSAPKYDPVSKELVPIEVDTIEHNELYLLRDDKLYYLLSESESKLMYNSLGIDESPFEKKSKMIVDSIYLYSPLPMFEAGKIKDIEKKIRLYKTELKK